MRFDPPLPPSPGPTHTSTYPVKLVIVKVAQGAYEGAVEDGQSCRPFPVQSESGGEADSVCSLPWLACARRGSQSQTGQARWIGCLTSIAFRRAQRSAAAPGGLPARQPQRM